MHVLISVMLVFQGTDSSTLCYSGNLLCNTDTGCDGILFPGDLTMCDVNLVNMVLYPMRAS